MYVSKYSMWRFFFAFTEFTGWDKGLSWPTRFVLHHVQTPDSIAGALLLYQSGPKLIIPDQMKQICHHHERLACTCRRASSSSSPALYTHNYTRKLPPPCSYPKLLAAALCSLQVSYFSASFPPPPALTWKQAADKIKSLHESIGPVPVRQGAVGRGRRGERRQYLRPGPVNESLHIPIGLCKYPINTPSNAQLSLRWWWRWWAASVSIYLEGDQSRWKKNVTL